MKISTRRKVSLLLCCCVALIIQSCFPAVKSSIENDSIAKQHSTDSNYSYLYVYRPPQIVGSAVTSEIFLNGRLMGLLDYSTFMRIKLIPNSYQLSAKINNSYIFKEKVSMSLHANENIYVRFRFVFDEKTLEVISMPEAVKEINDLSLVESNDYL